MADLSLDEEALPVGHPKKRLELVALKAAVGRMRRNCTFSERRACGFGDRSGDDVPLSYAAIG